MPSFSSFSNILPDPINKIGLAGQVDATGSAGPGFAAVKISSDEPIMNNIPPSGRRESDGGLFHRWLIDIEYNPLPCSSFYPLYAFLGLKRKTMEGFYVSLPQYSSQATANKPTATDYVRGDEIIIVNGTGVNPGNICTFAGSTKIYMVTRVETESNYNTQDSQPGAGKERLHITPPLQRDVSGGTHVIFNNPMFYVQEVDAAPEYVLSDRNLYSFSLKLEEVLDA